MVEKKPYTCPTCAGRKTGCKTCEATGVVWRDVEPEESVEQTPEVEALDLTYRR